MKEFPDFIAAKHGSASMWLRRNLASPSLIELMADADRLFERSDCVIIKDQKKIKVGRVTLDPGGNPSVVYVKRYNAFSLRYRLKSLFVRSGAARSLRGTAILSTIGISTARPVAAIEHRRLGMLAKSFYVSEEITGGETTDAYWNERLASLPDRERARSRRRFLRQLAQLFSRLHNHDIYHNDLKDANIVTVPDAGTSGESFFLLDLEGVRRYKRLSKRRRVKNLVQLHRTLGQYMKQTDCWYFLTCYLACQVADRQGKKLWAERVLRQSARLQAMEEDSSARKF